MRTPPEALPDADLVRLLTEAWHFSVVDLRYAPVGFGSHHWVATDARGSRRFVTVDEVSPPGRGDGGAGLDRLGRALRTAHALRETAELAFVVAPIPTADGDVLCCLGPRYAAAVYPFVSGRPYPDEHSTPHDRAAVVRLLAQLHASTATAEPLAGVDDLRLAGRVGLERTLGRLAEPWTGGPLGEATRDLLTSAAADIRRLLGVYDRLADSLLAGSVPWVITHGEPKADNVLATDAGPVLLDWDTALLAPAARDLWMVARGFGEEEQAHYAQLTGRLVPDDDLGFYRLRWDLSDIADFTQWFAGPHTHTADSEIAWNALSQLLRPRDRWPELF